MSPALFRPSTSGVPLRDLIGPVSPQPAADDGAAQIVGFADAGDARAGDVVVTGVTLDSRAVAPGDLYAALPGFNVHGARFAADAVAHGAVAVLTDAAGAALLGTLAVPVLVADRPRSVLGTLASHIYGDPSAALTMVGVTGTNGKTTTSYLIEAGLRTHGSSTGLVGTVETRIGDEALESVRTTPEATDLHAILAVMRERGIQTCVMEVSSHALDQHRVDGVVYDLALFTNLSQDHLDYHPSMEAYFEAKATLFTPARARRAIVCVDDEWGRRLVANATIPVVTMSTTVATSVATNVPTTGPTSVATDGTIGGPADWVASTEADRLDVFELRETVGDRRLHLVCHLPGTFNIANTALAALALLELGLSPTEVEAALSVPPAVPGRMEVVAEGGAGGPRCIVDFAHTPDAVDAALAALRPSTAGRLIAVLGAGGDRDRGKREAMGRAAARRADVVVVTDDNPRSEDPATIRSAVLAGARAAAATGAGQTEVIDGGRRSEAISEAVALAVLDWSEAGRVDTVVVLGKGHEKGQEVLGVTHPFDDRDAVRAALTAASVAGGDA